MTYYNHLIKYLHEKSKSELIQLFKTHVVETSSPEEKIATLCFIMNVTGLRDTSGMINDAFGGFYKEHRFVGITYNDTVKAWRGAGGVKIIPFSELAEFTKSINVVHVKLNDSNIAQVYSDKIVVGCQTFPITVIGALKTAHETLQ